MPLRWDVAEAERLAILGDEGPALRGARGRERGRSASTGSPITTEMALYVLAYNLTRVMNILGTGPLLAARA